MIVFLVHKFMASLVDSKTIEEKQTEEDSNTDCIMFY